MIHNEITRARHRQAAGFIFSFDSQTMIGFSVGAVSKELEGGYTQAAMKTTGVMGSGAGLARRSALCYRLSGISERSYARQRRDTPQKAIACRVSKRCERSYGDRLSSSYGVMGRTRCLL